MKNVFPLLRAGMPDFQMKNEDMVAEEDKVAIHASWHGTHKSEIMGIPPTGKKNQCDVNAILPHSKRRDSWAVGRVRHAWYDAAIRHNSRAEIMRAILANADRDIFPLHQDADSEVGKPGYPGGLITRRAVSTFAKLQVAVSSNQPLAIFLLMQPAISL